MFLCADVMRVMTARHSLKIKLCKTFVRQKGAHFSQACTHARTHIHEQNTHMQAEDTGRKFQSKKDIKTQGLGLSKILAN
jgi:hypothetical protein